VAHSFPIKQTLDEPPFRLGLEFHLICLLFAVFTLHRACTQMSCRWSGNLLVMQKDSLSLAVEAKNFIEWLIVVAKLVL